MAVCILTNATHSEGYFPALQAACARAGVPLHVLGWSERWTGFASKQRRLLQWLRAVSISSDERAALRYVCFVDAFDVIPTFTSAEELEASLHEALASQPTSASVSASQPASTPGAPAPKSVLIGVDRVLENTVAAHVQALGQKRIFRTCLAANADVTVNAGVFAGTPDGLQRFLELWLAGDETEAGDVRDDQVLLSRICERSDAKAWFDANVRIDETARFFYTTSCGFGQRPVLSVIGPRVLFLHGAGNCDLDDVARALGLPLPATKTRSKPLVQRAVEYAPHFGREIVIACVVLILVALFIGFGVWGSAFSTLRAAPLTQEPVFATATATAAWTKS